jgi:hypothetical protein
MTTRIINYLGWGVVLSVSVYFIINNALHYFIYNSAHYPYGFWPIHAPWLLVHIICGMTALLLGPFQFIPAIRKSYPKTHRTMGKTYLICVLIAAIASFDLSIRKIIIGEKAVAYGAGLAMLGFVWLLTSGMAYWSAISRNFVQHREWMVRSFVVTCAFASFRLIDNLLVHQLHVEPNASAEIMAWSCWAVPLIITEVFLQAGKIRKGNAALANKKRQAVTK